MTLPFAYIRTPADAYEASKGYGSLNDASLYDENELLRLLGGLWYEMAHRAAYRFVRRSGVAAPGAGLPWAPATDSHGLIVRVEASDGTKIEVVPVDDREAAFDPRVYRIGDLLYSVNGDPNPATDTIYVFAPVIPNAPVDWSEAFSLDIPYQSRMIFGAKVAWQLAIKDGRTAEAAEIDKEVTRLMDLWVAEGERFRAMVDSGTYPPSLP